MKNLVVIISCLLIVSCNSKDSGTSSVAPSNVSLEGYEVVQYSGSDVQKATKLDGAKKMVEEGELLNNKKSGTWVTYFPESGRVKTITNYINGKKNGIYLELNDRGSAEIQCNYVDDTYHGKWIKFKYGSRMEKEINYNMGKFDGKYKEFHGNGKLMKEIEYNNGVQDGIFRQYNEEEQVVMEYNYKNGEKISGGIVTPTPSPAGK